MSTSGLGERILYTRHEAADMLRISVSHLDNETRARRIRRAKFGSGGRSRVMYRPADLEQYIEDHLVQ